MKYTYNLSDIVKIENGLLYYEVNGQNNQIDLKKSAHIWWDKHNQETFWDRLLGKRQKNIYVGDKCFDFVAPYIRLYVDDDELIFTKEIKEQFDTSDVCELRVFWDDINVKLNNQGFWLFDEG